MTRPPATVSARAGSAATQLRGAAGNTSQSCPRVILEIGVFFDGTLNNEVNSGLRGSDTSYTNARSNVSLLKDLYKSRAAHDVRNACGGFARKYRRLYVEGAGTVAGEGDNTTGAALGLGATGIESRVFKACTDIGDIIRIESPGVEPAEIIMDVFGFSRGAASARYFVNCFRQGFILYNRYFINRTRATLPPNRRVRFRFIGIFDTVAAVGIGTNDDNGPVNVHLSTAQATKIFHLTADNEFRRNFRLNNNQPGGGERRRLPGAHSDVGGGYRAQGDESTTRSWIETRSTQAAAQAARAQYEAQNRTQSGAGMDVWRQDGWVDGDEPAGSQRFVLGQIRTIRSALQIPLAYQFSVQHVISRPWVRPGLSRIPLRIMYNAAVAAGVPFLSFPTSVNYTVPPEIAAVGNKLIANTAITAAEKASLLRGFGHVSANVNGVTNTLANAPEPNRTRTVYANLPGQAK
jgi:Uncharacterized alpha/beta hydrolase domain (DUF2235)